MKTEKINTKSLSLLVIIIGLLNCNLYADLVAQYEFEGDANDSAGGVVGTLMNGASIVTDAERGQVLSLDGFDDYVKCGASFTSVTGSNTKTIMAWAKSNTTDYPIEPDHYGGGRILSLYRITGSTGFSIYGSHSPATWGGLYWKSSIVQEVDSGISVITDQWTHIAMVQNGADVNIYINGILENTLGGAIGPGTSSSPPNAEIGCFFDNVNMIRKCLFNGMIDDVRIYDHALSDDDIAQIYQEDIGGITYHVDGATGDNGNDGLTRDTAFETIQYAIDEANDFDTVLVWPGVYNEAATFGINFMGKAITVKSAADAAVLEVPGYAAVTFVAGEGENSVFSNFVVRGSGIGIFALFSSPTISNVTVVDNNNGVITDNAGPYIINSIFFNNTNGDLLNCTAQYSWVEDEQADPNLVAYWKFDSDANDSVGGVVGSLMNGASIVTDAERGKVLSLDGLDDYVDCGAPFDAITESTTKTIMAWAKSNTTDYPTEPDRYGGGRILSLYKESGSTGFSIYGSHSPATWGGLYWKSSTAQEIDSGISVVVDQWKHIAMVQNGADVNIYINGTLENTLSGAIGPSTSRLHNAEIGCFYDDVAVVWKCFFNGLIDDVQMYDSALSDEEIEDIYEVGLAGGEYGSPLFADVNAGDYHLLSERGRYRATTDEWILDNVTSPCVDAGDPNIEPTEEPMPNGGQINMGAYGNTATASMSEWLLEADFDRDGIVNFKDFATFVESWTETLPWAE
ncbi:MAG: LamG domain-containing protein [Planctomycetota bacterium]